LTTAATALTATATLTATALAAATLTATGPEDDAGHGAVTRHAVAERSGGADISGEQVGAKQPGVAGVGTVGAGAVGREREGAGDAVGSTHGDPDRRVERDRLAV
jgi:hypothetical protein